MAKVTKFQRRERASKTETLADGALRFSASGSPIAEITITVHEYLDGHTADFQTYYRNIDLSVSPDEARRIISTLQHLLKEKP